MGRMYIHTKNWRRSNATTPFHPSDHPVVHHPGLGGYQTIDVGRNIDIRREITRTVEHQVDTSLSWGNYVPLQKRCVEGV
jgi:hypothetical protein